MGRRDFPHEFKSDAILLVVEQQYSFAQACEAMALAIAQPVKFEETIREALLREPGR
jgi:hypothetical protein